MANSSILFETKHLAMLWEKYYDSGNNNTVKCKLCAHYCTIDEHKRGTCLTRINEGGILYSLTYGKAESYSIDPIEKKPFFHFKPGSKALSFGANGCNFSCLHCQNHHLSQVFRTVGRRQPQTSGYSPETLAEIAINKIADGIAYTYSEPTIFFEYARDTILACREMPETKNLFHVFVSNGYFSTELIDLFVQEDLISAVNIDLKFIDDEKYRRISGARLEPILRNIKLLNQLKDKIHIEIINLIIPGENDDENSIRRTAEFICSVDPDIPLHFTRFYPHYNMSSKNPTNINILLRAREIAYETGLKYVYVGNTIQKNVENTYCPNCKELLIARDRYFLESNVFKNIAGTKNPKCPK
ncbi:MAG: AmmeMemoRadiSam system radical enzyme, partial [Bacteroidota bacterium]|nr:AmmeMemoRadiSam system radical enzyme [Bacteroidota bacterium]